jgi:tetratricopeptide (TPR) repeat protein
MLEDLLRRYTQTGLEIPSNDEVIETLLTASKFGPLARRCLLLSLVDQLLEKTASTHLQAEAVYQRSVVLRLKGDIIGSNKLLQEFLDRSDMATRLKSHFILGLLHLSQAANHAYNLDFSSASKEVKMWIPPNSDATQKQLDVVWSQIHSAGRILRGQGQFNTACFFFERCLQMESLHTPRRYLALSHLVDTYIEVDYLRRRDTHSIYAGELLSKAENLIAPEIKYLKSHAQRSKGFRRLLLSSSEIEIRQNRFDKADRLLVELCDIYAKLADPDIVDRHGHLRAFISLARISPVSEVESRWIAALNLGRRYYPLEEEVFIVAFMHLFICAARLLRGDMEGGKAAFDYAAEICRIKSPQFVMPGLGTYLFDDVRCQIESLVGWKLPQARIL